jgi:dipeptidyl aminopeptidase/acylaminoacyl peptidase
MTELEDRIRDALADPRWELAVWPDPMRRVRRAAARQRAGLGAATIVALAAVVTLVALLSGLVTHGPRLKPSAVGVSPAPSRLSSRSAVPSWARRLGGEVAYKCADSLCLMRPNGTGKRTLAGASIAWDPAWSPDGRQLAFRGYYPPYHEGDYAIYVGKANGCHATKLTKAMNGGTPSWSPSGRQIAFAVGGISVINANGTGYRSLTKDTRQRLDDSPAWSAGDRIAFVRTGTGTSLGEIYTINPDGSGVAALTHGGPGFFQPSWSHTGRQIAFVVLTGHSMETGSPMAIEVANADGSGVHPVTPRTWASYSPTWTPDGKIAFLRQTGASTPSAAAPTSVYIVNRDGSGLRLLYRNLDAMQIAWGATTLRPSRGALGQACSS